MRVPAAELDWWKVEAQRRGWSVAVLIRKAMVAYVEANPSPAPIPDETERRVREARQETANWITGLLNG